METENAAPTYFFLYLRRKFWGERGSQRTSKTENAAQNLCLGVWRRICGAEASLPQGSSREIDLIEK